MRVCVDVYVHVIVFERVSVRAFEQERVSCVYAFMHTSGWTVVQACSIASVQTKSNAMAKSAVTRHHIIRKSSWTASIWNDREEEMNNFEQSNLN